MQDEEDRALCNERLSWILSNSPHAGRQDFGGVSSYALTADLAGLASSESSSSYADFCCDESSLQERHDKVQLQCASGATLTAAAARTSHTIVRTALQHGEAQGPSRTSGYQQQSRWPLSELLEIIRYAAHS